MWNFDLNNEGYMEDTQAEYFNDMWNTNQNTYVPENPSNMHDNQRWDGNVNVDVNNQPRKVQKSLFLTQV